MALKDKDEIKVSQNPKLIGLISYGLLFASALIIVGITTYLYFYTQNLLSERLYERMTAIASTAARMFEAEDVNALLEMGPEMSMKTNLYKQTVMKLKEIKEANMDVTFAYLYGKTADPNTVVFVADADVIALKPELNFNENEVTDEGFPGSEFDVSEIPLVSENVAFVQVIIDEYFYDTIWGRLMTTYAPIKNEGGEAQVVLGIDVDISDFNRLVKATFVPFALFVVLLLVLLSILTLTLVRMWQTRVDLVVELDKQKDELLSIVSHQLATPVSSMKWYLEMMLDGDIGKLTNEQEQHVKTLQLSAANLTDLVHMILDVSRIQLGRMKVDRTDLDLNGFYEEVIAVIDAKANERGVKFEKNMPEKLPIAWLDKRLMHMTLENLLSNAVKYTPKGGKVTLNVNISNNELHYEVIDTGCGIPKVDQDKIFGKLFRASNVQKIDGNGFGLYVAKGGVEAQGGVIDFQSVEGKGTTFIVKIPLVKPEEKNFKGK